MGIAKGCKSSLAWAEGLMLPSPLKVAVYHVRDKKWLSRQDAAWSERRAPRARRLRNHERIDHGSAPETRRILARRRAVAAQPRASTSCRTASEHSAVRRPCLEGLRPHGECRNAPCDPSARTNRASMLEMETEVRGLSKERVSIRSSKPGATEPVHGVVRSVKPWR
jgi:hypothetical protein